MSRQSDFNPRSREGSDLSAPLYAFMPMDFNPRSREGSDDQQWELRRFAQISIHAPVKGATTPIH